MLIYVIMTYLLLFDSVLSGFQLLSLSAFRFGVLVLTLVFCLLLITSAGDAGVVLFARVSRLVLYTLGGYKCCVVFNFK